MQDLEKHGHLIRIKSSIDPYLEMAEIQRRAYEAQAPPTADFDSDHDVDGTDFLAWQRGYGTTVGATRPGGNSVTSSWRSKSSESGKSTLGCMVPVRSSASLRHHGPISCG